MPEWPSYQSHKIVQAAKIVGFATRETTGERLCAVVVPFPARAEQESFSPSVHEMLIKAEIGDWAIQYPDGYRSISPAQAFEEGYSPCLTT